MERITPWLTEPSIDHISRFLNNRPNSKILEFGCGSSTLWFDQNFDCELVSIEHDESWYNRTLNRISKAGKTTINLIERPYYHVVKNYDDNYFDTVSYTHLTLPTNREV